jgi:hypothetical protein
VLASFVTRLITLPEEVANNRCCTGENRQLSGRGARRLLDAVIIVAATFLAFNSVRLPERSQYSPSGAIVVVL